MGGGGLTAPPLIPALEARSAKRCMQAVEGNALTVYAILKFDTTRFGMIEATS